MSCSRETMAMVDRRRDVLHLGKRGKGAGANSVSVAYNSATVLDGYLYPSTGAGRHPAVVFLHGCSGMFNRSTGLISRWAGLGVGAEWGRLFGADGR